MDAFKTINDVLVNLFYEILELEEKAIITDEFQDISNNDMHIIEAIGLGDESTMSAVARRQGVTAGSLTTSINSLVKKGYVVRSRSEQDRRIVYISLTEKGRKAYYHHENFHREMITAAVKNLSEEELPLLARTLNGLAVFFRNYGEYKEEVSDGTG
nr:MarR family transcriptional regulator [uncultured Schaedlerella sp.]